MKYIPADKLIAKIERLKQEIKNKWKENPRSSTDDGFLTACSRFFEIINSLQQEQPIQVNTLTWKDINDLERIINNVHYEFRNGIGEKSFGEEVLERFREGRDEHEQPEVDLEKEYKEWWETRVSGNVNIEHTMEWFMHETVRHFYELGLKARKEE